MTNLRYKTNNMRLAIIISIIWFIGAGVWLTNILINGFELMKLGCLILNLVCGIMYARLYKYPIG